ncbi:hypothetical protein FRC10_012231 [Ceratobasidium sp. 414]|nr:hypothetical protein FRC10_012231 [Ceratobasidium sp. 414]
MRKTFASNDPNTFHYEPFKHCWKPPSLSGPAQTLSGEMYTSPVMIKAHWEVQNLNIPCDLPRHVKGWPILCSFGNVSKYERCKPTSNTCHPVAHIPMLPDKVKEQITDMHGKAPNDALLTHLRHELMHMVWVALLDDEFIEAWRTGIVILCADGVRCRVFPRILTYSVDYPEKVLLATVRNGGACLCPRCFVNKNSASQMGTPTNMSTRKKQRIDNEKCRGKVECAWHLIYDQGKPIQGKDVEDLLKGESYVPTTNVFSDRLGDFKFDIFSVLVVDQLHEVELGVWKALFQHLIRLLYRFRCIPTFASTIQMFAEDVADMGRTAAHDFKDVLQCCAPAFKGLLPKECDQPAQSLLFLYAEWHGLAKLCLHTTASLKIFKTITSRLGTALQNFVKITKNMEVHETPKEYAHRKRQAEASKVTSMMRCTHTTTNPAHAGKAQLEQNSDGDGHDYPGSIEEHGTTDSYSTQIGELQNQKYKAQYMRTNKCNAIEQMTEIDNIMAALQDIDKELQVSLVGQPVVDTGAIDSLVSGEPYFIGQKERSEDLILNISIWIAKQSHDSAVKFFLPQLKQHLLGQIRDDPNHADFSDSELAQVDFYRGRMYQHKTLRVNYNFQDTLKSGTPHCFIMLPTESRQEPNTHLFIYAKVLGVYHAKILYCGRPPQ